MDARSKILKERDNPQLLNRVAPNLSITRPRENAKAKKTSTGAPHSTVKYKSYGDPSPNVLKKKPSEVVEAKLHPQVSYKDGSIRPKPHIIEHHNFCDKNYLIASSVSKDCPLFQPFPPEIVFSNFEAFKKYSTVIHLRNNDKIARRVQVLPLISEFLNVQPYCAYNSHDLTMFDESGTGRVAPGMEIPYIVNFCPETEDDQEASIVVVTEREKFEVPVICNGMRAILDLPDEVHFPNTPAKCVYTKNVMLRNHGKRLATFQLSTSGFFVVTPRTGTVDPGNFLEVYIQFRPPLVGTHEGELIASYNNNDERMYCKLLGIGLELDVGLSADVAVAVPTYIRRESQMVVHVQNYSPVVAYFIWEKFATEKEDAAYLTQVEASDKGRPYGAAGLSNLATPEGQSPLDTPKRFNSPSPQDELEKAFRLSPATGECWPNSRTEITIIFTPPRALRYYCKAYCTISGKSERLELQLEGTGVGPLTQFVPAKLDLQELYLFQYYDYEVKLQNKGDLEARFQLLPTNTKAADFMFEPSEGAVPTGQTQIIHVKAYTKLQGVFESKFVWNVEGSQYNPALFFRGHVGNPNICINALFIEFGLIAYGFSAQRSFKVRNCSMATLNFKIYIVQCDCRPAFTVEPELTSIKAQSSQMVTVIVSPNDVQQYMGVLHIFLLETDEAYITIPITADCQIAKIKLDKDLLDFGTCFIRYSYSRTCTLSNCALVCGKFEVQEQDSQTQSATAKLAAVPTKGVVEEESLLSIEYSLSTLMLGEISFVTAVIANPGDKKQILPLRIKALSIGPILRLEPEGWDPPPKPVNGEDRMNDGRALWSPVLDFGFISVLEDHHLSFIIRNMCCIPAPVVLSNKLPAFWLNHSEKTVEPFGSLEVVVIAHLDDTSKFTDKVIIEVEGGTYSVTLIAVGLGSTLVCDGLANGSVHFGTQLSYSIVTKPFDLDNQGKFHQAVTWERDPEVKKSAKAIFSFTPVKITIPPHTPFSFNVTGSFQGPGFMKEIFFCRVVYGKQKEQLYKMIVDANVVSTKLLFSKREIRFVQLNDGKDHPDYLTEQLTVQNVYASALTFKFLLKPPFAISQVDAKLEPTESLTVDVTFEWQSPTERKSTVCSGKLDIVYTDTVQRDSLNLFGEIHFPNLRLSAHHMDFEAVIEHTCKRLQMRIKNPSAMDVSYVWAFYNHDPQEDIKVSFEARKKSKGLKLPLNQIFDILPIRATLYPGEQELVEVSYYAFPGYKVQATAVCRVEGGPEYFLTLEAESAVIKYSINRLIMDVGMKAYNHTSLVNNLVLRNIGKTHFDFELDLTPFVRPKTVRISPVIGHLRGSTRQRFNIRVIPSMPVRFKEAFLMQVAYFAPHEITVMGEGTYPSLWIDAPRVRNRQFLSYVEQARRNVIEKWVENMVAKLKKKKDPMEFTTEVEESEEDEEDTPPTEESSGDSDQMAIESLFTSRRDTTAMLERIEVIDEDEEARRLQEAKDKAERDLKCCGHVFHRKSRSPLTGKGSPLAAESGKKLPWRRPSFFERRLEAQREDERKHHARHQLLDHSCGHNYHRKSRSSLTGSHSELAKEKVKGLPWLRQSFMARAEERRIAKLYGDLVHVAPIQQKPSLLPFPIEFDRGGLDEDPCVELEYEEWDDEAEDLEQMFEDIDAEVDRLVVLEGFYTPLPWVPFFPLGEDEDLSSDEEEDENDLLCKHGLHRKSRSPLTGKFSPMMLEVTSGKGLHWLRQSFIDRAEEKRVEKLYKLRKSILRKESLQKEGAQSESIVKRIEDGNNNIPADEEPHKDPAVEVLPLRNVGEIEDGHIDHHVDGDHDHENRADEFPEPPINLVEGAEGNLETKEEMPDINIQRLTCNRFEVDFQNVLKHAKKRVSVMLYNGGVLPVVHKIDKTVAKSKGFDIQPDKVIVLPGEPNNDKGYALQVTFQTESPNLTVGPVHAWVQMNVREGPMTMLLLKANVVLPELHLSTEYIDFGTVQVSRCKVWYVRVKNVGEHIAEWSAGKPESTANVTRGLMRDWPYFKLVPNKATLLPDESMDVQVQFSPIYKPMKSQYLTEIPLRIIDSVHMPVIHCMGRSSYQAITIDPPFMELDPILPSAPTPAIFPFTVRNRSEHPIEIYSLEFDPQYVTEDHILRACKKYNEDGVMHLNVREAGEPFWEDLAAEYSVLQGGQAPNVDQPKPKDTPPPPKGKPDPKAKEAKQSLQVTDPVTPAIKSGPVMVIYGAPFSGKTTQARLLAKRYKCPIIDVDDLMVTAAENGSLLLPLPPGSKSDEAVKEEILPPPPPPPSKGKKQPVKPVGEPVKPGGGEFEASLQELLKLKMQVPGSANGVIFDGLSSNHVPVLTLIKSILGAIGLQASEGQLITPAKGDEPGKSQAKVVWKGDAMVHLIKLRARKRRLYRRFLDLEDQHHARVRKYETPGEKKLHGDDARENDRTSVAVEVGKNNSDAKDSIKSGANSIPVVEAEPATEPLKVLTEDGSDPDLLIPPDRPLIYVLFEAEGVQKVPKVLTKDGIDLDLRFNTPYPWYLAFPTAEEVARYYTSEEEILAALGGVLTPEDIVALDTKLVLAITDGMQDQKAVHEQVIESLPLPPDHDVFTPPPQLYQSVKNPPYRKIVLDPQFPFSFLTKLEGSLAAPDSPKSVASTATKGSKGKPPPKADPKATAAGGAVSDLTPHTVLPPGYVKKTRWVIPAYEKLDVALLFWSRDIEEFEHTFRFEVLGWQGYSTLQVEGICDVPRILLRQVTHPSRKLRISPCHGVTPRHPRVLAKIVNRVINFGTVNTAPLPAGFPKIPDSEHCYRVDIENIGQFDLHVDFQLLQDVGAPSPAPSDKSAAPSPKKGGKPEVAKKGVKPGGRDGGSPFILHPTSLDLKIDESKDLCIYSYPAMGMQGKLNYKLICTIINNPRQLEYNVTCLADTPKIELDPAVLNIGRVLLGCRTTKTVMIKNLSELKVAWTMAHLEELPEEFEIAPTHGKIKAKASYPFKILFKSIEENVFNLKVVFQVSDSKELDYKVEQEVIYPVTAEAYILDVVVKYPNNPDGTETQSGLNFGTVKVAEAQMKPLILENKGKHKVGFKFVPQTLLVNDLFNFVPNEGEIASKGQQKVDVYFNKDQKLASEVSLKRSRDLQLHLIECETNVVEKIQTIFLDLVAVHSQFLLLPAHGLHFGYAVTGHLSEGRILKILNRGVFPFDFNISSPTSLGYMDAPKVSKSDVVSQASGATRKSSKTVASAKTTATTKTSASKRSSKSDKGKDKGGGGAAKTLELQGFRVSPAAGNILPGEKVDILIFFKAPQEPEIVSEQLLINITDKDPEKYPEDIKYDLTGESQLPGITTVPDVIFEEHQIIDKLENPAVTPPFGVYSRHDHIFSFGAFIIDCDRPFDGGAPKIAPKPSVRFTGDTPKPKVMNAPIGRKVEANFRIDNPFKVPCIVDFVITPTLPEKETQAPYEDPFAMFVQPSMLEVPPHGFRYVCVAFQPLSMQCYFAIFEALVRDGGDNMQTKIFKCHLQGEGTLPHLQITDPTRLSPSGVTWLQFPRLRVGKTMTKSFQLHNKGIVPAVTTIDVKGGGVPWCLLSHQSGIIETPLYPGQTLSIKPNRKETFLVTFVPLAGELYEREIKLDIQNNPYAGLSILVTGEGYWQEVECVGLPGNRDDAIWYGDGGFNVPRVVKFSIKNNAQHKHWRFAWPVVDKFTFSPATGHLHAGASKSITATFLATEAVQILDQPMNVFLYNIKFPEGEETPPDWDSDVPDPVMIALAPVTTADPKAGGGAKGKLDLKAAKGKPDRKAAKGSTPAKGKLDATRTSSTTVASPDPDVGTQEPPHEIVVDSNLALSLKLHAVADTARYECECQGIHFKATMMYQSRTHTFTLKNLSTAMLPLRWQILKEDNNPGEHEIYHIDSPTEVKPGETETIMVKFAPIEVEDCTRFLVSDIDFLEPGFTNINIPLTGSVTRPWCHFKLPRSDYISGLQRDANRPGPNGYAGPLDPETRVIEFESLGIHAQNIKSFVALNPTNTTLTFEWEQVPDPAQEWREDEPDRMAIMGYLSNPFRCLCKYGVIEAGQSHEMGFDYTPNKHDLVETFWIFKLLEVGLVVPFLLVGSVVKPDLCLDTQTINFGRVLVGERQQLWVKLTNNEGTPFPFRFDKQEYERKRDTGVYMKELQGWVHNEIVVVPDLIFEPNQGMVPANGVREILVTYSPMCEGKQNFNVTCHVKRSLQINLNIKGEGYSVHDKIFLEIVEDMLPLQLSATSPNVVMFGEVLINDKIFKKFLLTNVGVFSFEFLWLVGKTAEVVVTPLAGVIGPEEKIVCEMAYCPATVGPVVNFPVTCRVFKSNRYKVLFNGLCYRARISFSWYHFDFGPTFLHVPTREAPSCMLLATNTGVEQNIVELMYNSTPQLEMAHTTWVMQGGQQDYLMIHFMPREYIKYNEKVSFLINGLDTMSVWVHGEGTPLIVELVDQSQKLLSFGQVHMGEVSIKKVAIINKSEALLPISFEPSRRAMAEIDIELLPYDGLRLKPHQIGICEVIFAPKQRVPKFHEIVPMDMSGVEIVLLSVAGIGIGTDIILSTHVLHFGTIVLGSQKTIRMQVENVGELGSLFTWDTETWVSDLTFYPKDGFLAPHQVTNIDVTLHPSSVLYDIRLDRIGCTVVGGETLYLTVTGGCIEKNLPENYSFKAPVRSSDTKTIPLVNTTTRPWYLYPKIIHKFFSGVGMITVPAGETVEYEVTYKPMTMTKPPNEPQHEGSILFGLPDGSALFYSLIGVADDPLPEAEFTYDIKARTTTDIYLSLYNWTKVSQHLRLVVTMPPHPGYGIVSTLEGPPIVEVPGLSTRECQLYFMGHKNGVYPCVAKFIDDQTREFLFFNLTFNVRDAEVVDRIPFNTITRELRVHTLHVQNPLDMMVSFNIKCDDPEVRVPSNLDVQPLDLGAIDIQVRLIRPCQKVGVVTFSSDILGDYRYELLLRAVEAGPEPPIHFDVPLGNRHTQKFQFVHFLPSKALYMCTLSAEAVASGFLIEKNTVDANPADLDGLEVQVPLTFEPSAIASNYTGMMTVENPLGGTYTVKLYGSCHPPIPQGPIIIKGGVGQVNFRNVFTNTMDYLFQTDNPAFTVGKGEKIPAKKPTKIKVSYKSIPGAPANGKLMVSCPEYGPWIWIFYLQGV